MVLESTMDAFLPDATVNEATTTIPKVYSVSVGPRMKDLLKGEQDATNWA